MPSSRHTSLIVSELMYHPPYSYGFDLEYVELFNTEPFNVDIGGFRLEGAVHYTFPAGTVLTGRAFVVVAKDPIWLEVQTGYRGALGPFDGKLDDAGETLQLVDARGSILLDIPYGDRAPWPVAADGAGHSLVMTRPDYGEADPRAWSSSAAKLGTPGTTDPGPAYPGLCINELFVAGTGGPGPFIEVFNAGSVTQTLTGCYLTDDAATPKVQITNTVVLAPGTGAVFLAALWTNQFGLGVGGGELYLLNPGLSVAIDAVKYDDQVADVACGRFPDGGDTWRAFRTPTPGGRNTAPLTFDIVVNEIMFNPLSGENDDEFVELYNKGTNAVDISGWRLADAVTFTMPAHTVMATNSYVVVAGNADRMLSNYPGLDKATVVGTFGGSLNNRGERLALEMPAAVAGVTSGFMVVDEVTYRDGWGAWADGGGSSLELIDPRSDNGMAGNWAGSDESGKAAWSCVCVTGVLDNGAVEANEVQVLLGDAGECVLDDIVIMKPNGGNLVANGTFEAGLTGWVVDGTHKRSQLDTTEAHAGANALRLVATGSGDVGANRVEADLSAELFEGETALIQAWARWRAGSQVLIVRLRGNYLEAATALPVPGNLGTPGARNSRHVANAGPAIASVGHGPVLPAGGQNVVVSARVHDPDGIGAVTVNYRLDPAVTWSSASMNDAGINGDTSAGDGIYSATLPGQASNQLVAFYVEGRDNATPAATNGWPARGRECLVRFGESLPTGFLGAYRMWISQSNMNVWIARKNLDNELIDGTFVYGDVRAVYEAGTRERGSSFIRPGYGDPDKFISSRMIGVSKNERVLGAASFNLDSIEQQDVGGGTARDPTFVRERTAFAIGRMLGAPTMHQRYVHVYLNGWKMGMVYYDVQDPNGDFLDQWSPGDTDGALFEIDDWFEYNDTPSAVFSRDARLQNYTTTGGVKKKARYRWNWELKPAYAADDNYQPLFSLVDAMNTAGTGYYDAVNALVDWDEWMRSFAFTHIVADWDHYGYNRGKNAFVYKPQRDRWKLYEWDFDFCLGQSYAPNADLFSIEDPVLRTLFYKEPAFLRAYWRFLYDAATTVLVDINAVIDNTSAGLLQQGLTVDSPADVKTWIAQRRTYILGQLNTVNVPFVITTAGGANFSTTNPVVAIAGTAPVGVKSIRVNGTAFPTTFTTFTNWQVVVGLAPGTNTLMFQGYSTADKPMSGMTDSIAVVYTGQQQPPYGAIVINELMYNPVGGGAEFIELHNVSPVYPLPLANCFFEGVTFAFTTTATIAPGGYAVVAENSLAFTEEYGAQIPVAGAYNGQLDNAGETLRLLRRDPVSGVTSLIDTVTFDDQPPWPAEADGAGPSLQLIDPTRDNNRVANWGVGIAPPYTPGAPNSICQSLPPIPDIRINEIQPLNTGYTDRAGDKDPWIELVVSGAVGECYLTDDLAEPAKWPLPTAPVRTNGTFLVVWADDEAYESTTNELHASFRLNAVEGIVAVTARLGGGTQVIDYLAYQLIGAGKSSGLYPDGDVSRPVLMWQPTMGATNKVVQPPLTVSINEWMASNTKTITDPADIAAGMGNPYDDWFELYNPGPAEADLSGCTLADSPTGTAWRIPNGTVVAPDSFLLVWADEDTGQNGYDASLHINFKLDKAGERIMLAYEGRTITEVTFGAQQSDISQGRWPDASTNVQDLAPATPGSYNAVPGHVPPFVAFTNCVPSLIVPSTTTSQYLAGTNSALTVGGMWWGNSAGGSGTLDPVPRAWSFIAGLVFGSNVVSVTGTNLEGKACSARVTIQRARVPFIAITNAVGYHGTATVAGTNTVPAVAGLWWTSSAGGAGALNPFPGSWSFIAGINPGTNVIVVTATNLAGEVNAVTVSLVRLPLAFLAITNGTGKVVVGSNTTAYAVYGTNNAFVAGVIRWTNLLNNAGGTAQGSSFTFRVTGIPLDYGSNAFAVTCTNAAGEVAGDSVIVFRASAPFVDITNADATVAMGGAQMTIAGTNNAASAGFMRLTSIANGITNYVASIPAAPSWSAVVANLAAGETNVVNICVTNAAGEQAGDSVRIYRRPLAVIAITNPESSMVVVTNVFGQYLAGTNNVRVVGGLAWTNTLGGAGTLPLGNWQFVAPVWYGTNVITVYGTNVAGDVASATLTVIVLPRPWLNANIDVQARTDLSGPAGGAGEVWNQILKGPGNIGSGLAVSNLRDFQNNVTTAGFTCNATQLHSWGTPSLTVLAAGTFQWDWYTPATIRFSGLNAANQYDIYLISFHPNEDGGRALFSTTNATMTQGIQIIDTGGPDGIDNFWIQGTNYARFRAVRPLANGTVSFTMVGDSGSNTKRAYLSGFQLADVTPVSLPFVNITTTNCTIPTVVTNIMVSGTNNAGVVGVMRLVSVVGTTTNHAASQPAATPWSMMVSNLVVGATNIVTVIVTNRAGVAASDVVAIYRQPVPGNPTAVLGLEARRAAAYGQVVLSWSNSTVTVLACTNRLYSTNDADWFVLSSGVATPWTHSAASNFPSVYYRIVSGSYTSQYAVGKYDINIAPGSIAWLSFPFAVQPGCGNLSAWFGRQLEARPYSLFSFPSFQSQDGPGGTVRNSDYYYDDWTTGTTNWFPSDAVIEANAGCILFLPEDHPGVTITALGMVQTNNVTMQLPYNSIPWVGLAYDVVMDMRQSGLTNMLQPPRLYSAFNYDFLDSQQTPGGPIWYAEYYRDNWGGNTIDFFPSATGADKLEPGKGYLLFFSTSRAGTGVWSCARPY